ncbi:MAG: hypothetical protein H5U40_07045, partial [Polyangiaceae bacterium]|nr:hypothetical protein [Polyangiaceae bacterium]
IPGSTTPIETLADAFAAADSAGYPVVLRPVWALAPIASARFEDEAELERGFDEYRRRAVDIPICLDHDLERARVLDVLVAADMHGDVVGICEQESTLSQAGGGYIDESPSPDLGMRPDGEAIRTSLFDTAIRLAAELGTPGLVTVRFLLDATARAYVSDVALGLTAQHAIAEMVTGLDLVGLQLSIAAGEPMPDEVHAVEPSGHAFGAVVGLGARRDDLEAVREIRFPPAPQRQVRVEPAVVEGQIPTGPLVDAVCRITTYAPIRHQALLTLDRMLAELEVSPLEVNVPLLRSVIAHESYRAGQYDTSTAIHLSAS